MCLILLLGNWFTVKDLGVKIMKISMFRNSWNAVYVAGAWRFVQCNWGARHLVNAKEVPKPGKAKSDSLRWQILTVLFTYKHCQTGLDCWKERSECVIHKYCTKRRLYLIYLNYQKVGDFSCSFISCTIYKLWISVVYIHKIYSFVSALTENVLQVRVRRPLLPDGPEGVHLRVLPAAARVAAS